VKLIIRLPRKQDLILLGRDAVATQNQQRIDHTIASVLPRLHGISSLLLDSHPLEKTPLLTEFHIVMQELTQHMNDIFAKPSETHQTMHPAQAQAIAIQQPQPTMVQTAILDARQTSKRTREVVLAPSPEPRQKRKVSRGVM
jgi:hypothetical protein